MGLKNPTKPGSCTGCPLYGDSMVRYSGSDNPDILLVGGFPVMRDIEKTSFQSQGGAFVRRIITESIKHMPNKEQPKIGHAYAVRCRPASTGNKVSKDIIDQCQPMLLSRITKLKPKMIVALGADAVKGLGFTANLGSVRGVLHERTVGDHKVKVLATYHPSAVFASPGLTSVLRNDLQKAITLVTSGMEELDFDLELPMEYSGVMAALDRFEEAIESNWEKTGNPLAVAYDTETTSVLPHAPRERVIMVSLSYREGQGLAFPWQHRNVPFTEEQFLEIKARTEKLLGDPRVFRILHNAKFDQKWLVWKERMKIPPADWDTMLMEHMLDEDKKGEYGLKELTCDYFPWAGKYEAELEAELGRLRRERSDEAKKIKEEYKAKVRELYVEYWLSLSDDQRLAKTASWVDKGLVKISQTNLINTPKYRKLKGEMVLTKKYQEATNKVLHSLPEEELELDIPELPELPDPKDVTYEDLPIEVLIRYAAIDAVMTRMIFARQLAAVREDGKLIKSVEKRRNRALPTKSLDWARRNLTNPLCEVITDMEYNGVRMDRDRIRTYIDTLDERLGEMRDQMYHHVGYEFNPNASAGDLSRILYEEMRLPVLKRTETGAPSTDAETIKFLADDHESEFLNKLLAFRKCEKVQSTYLGNWLKMSELDGRLHANFNQNGTATFRLSSSSPNL